MQKSHYIGCFFRKNRWFFTIVLIFYSSSLWASYDQQIVDAVKHYRNQNWKSVISQLGHLTISEKTPIQVVRKARWLLGKSYLQQHSYQKALTEFRLGRKSDSSNVDLWDYQILQVYLRSGQQDLAVPIIQTLLHSSDAGFYLRSIQSALIEMSHKPALWKTILPLFQTVFSQTESTRRSPSLVNAYFKIAQQILPNDLNAPVLYWKFPGSLDAAKQGSLLIGDSTRPLKERLQSEDYWERIQSLVSLGDSDYLLQQIFQLVPEIKTDEIRKKIGILTLKTLFRKKDYIAILTLYDNQSLSQIYHLEKSDQLFWIIRSYQKLRNLEPVRGLISELEALDPKDPALKEIYAKMAESVQMQGHQEESKEWWQKITVGFPASREAENAYWEMAWKAYQNNDYGQAIQQIDQALIQMPNTKNLDRLLYWKGYSAYLQNQKQKADQSIEKLYQDNPNSFYSLRLLSGSDPLEGSSYPFSSVIKSELKSWNMASGELPEASLLLLNRIKFLLSVGEEEQATHRLVAKMEAHQQFPRMLVELGNLLLEHQEYHVLQRLVANYYQLVLDQLRLDGQLIWKFAYPRAYWRHVERQSLQGHVDPYLSLSIMREESHFNAQAVSDADARGLMQLMPATAEYIAKKNKILFKEPQSLYEPQTNIRLGVSYLGELLRQFDGELVYAVGAYNAGPTNMKKWIEQWGSLPKNQFVENIPFEETRKYVKRVLKSYYSYRKIYSN